MADRRSVDYIEARAALLIKLRPADDEERAFNRGIITLCNQLNGYDEEFDVTAKRIATQARALQ